jgi:Cys-tRNA(Pro)/Cys-tRNA(Cys) deacylase
VRQLERARVAHRVLAYDHDPAHGSFGLEASERLGVPPAAVFKTLLVQPSQGPMIVALVPVSDQLDLKAAARAAGARRAALAEPGVAERSSGYVVGGISPFGQRKRLATYVDESAEANDLIYVSGGRRGLELEIAPSALVVVLAARFVALRAAG